MQEVQHQATREGGLQRCPRCFTRHRGGQQTPQTPRDTDKTLLTSVKPRAHCNGFSWYRGREKTLQRHTLVTSKVRAMSQPRAASLRRAEGKREGGALPFAPRGHHCSPPGQVTLRCFASGAAFSSELCTQLRPEVLVQRCKFPSGGDCSPRALQTRQEAPGLPQLLQMTLAGTEATATAFSGASPSPLLTPSASNSTLLISTTPTACF